MTTIRFAVPSSAPNPGTAHDPGRLMLLTAIVLSVAGPAKTIAEHDRLKRTDGVAAVHQVTRPHDIIVALDAPNLTGVPRIIRRSIRVVDGDQSSVTCLPFEGPGAAGEDLPAAAAPRGVGPGSTLAHTRG